MTTIRQLKSSEMRLIGCNGKVLRANGREVCDTCEMKVAAGSKMARVATREEWVTICETCVENFYRTIIGVQ